MPKPLVALLQPCAGRAAPWREAVKAFLRPTARGVERVEIEQGTTSTPRTFNMLYCDALNLRGQCDFTHVAMIHDDVRPDKSANSIHWNWLDILLDEMEQTGADMISAVVPIKSNHGLTSTAIDNAADPWVVRRLTMKEVFNLPETFGAEDVPWNKEGCLLPNTGLWIMRFDEAWAEDITFQFVNDKRKGRDGWHSIDTAEDWDLGRQLHGLGKKVLCTRKVPLAHGEERYHTRTAWGDWPTDLAYLTYHQRQNNQTFEGWRFPEDVLGWLSLAEGQKLAELAAGKIVLEIGSYCGRSTISMAQTAQRVFAVDTFDGRATTLRNFTLQTFMENLIRYRVLEKVAIYQGESDMTVPGIDQKFDMVFIDGAHYQEAVLRDATSACGALKPDGVLAFHDYGRAGDEGVTSAVDLLLAQGAELLGLTETLAIVKPAA